MQGIFSHLDVIVVAGAGAIVAIAIYKRMGQPLAGISVKR